MIKRKNKIYKFMIIYLIFTIILTLFTFIYAMLINNEIITLNLKYYRNISFIIGLILFFILGLISGIVAKRNGLIEGLLSSLIIIAISFLLNLILKFEIEAIYFVKIICYLIISMSGGIIGVNIVNK